MKKDPETTTAPGLMSKTVAVAPFLSLLIALFKKDLIERVYIFKGPTNPNSYSSSVLQVRVRVSEVQAVPILGGSRELRV